MPRHRWPRLGSADEPRGMDAWVFMAPKCCAVPFPALKPNPNRLILSAGHGDYPKRKLHVIPTALAQPKERKAKAVPKT